MVKKYNNISVIATSNQPGTTGEVLEAAVKAGAALEGMQWIQIHPHGNPKTENSNPPLPAVRRIRPT